MKTTTKTKIIPGPERVLIKLLSHEHINPQSNILIPGQAKAGENLLFGQVIEGGKTKFSAGMFVYYSEYSASALYPLGAVKRGEMTFGEAQKETNKLYVVAEDDIMAYEEDYQAAIEESTSQSTRKALKADLFPTK